MKFSFKMLSTVVLLIGLAAQTGLVVSSRSGPDWQPAQGVENLEAKLDALDLKDDLIRLTHADGAIDVVIAGAPECSHCQALVRDELDGVIASAGRHDLDVAYMPMALSAYGVTIASASRCAHPQMDGVDILRADYALVDVLEQALKDAQDDDARKAAVMETIGNFGKTLSPDGTYEPSCFDPMAEKVSAAMSRFMSGFSLEAMPTIWVQMGPGNVQVLRGISSADQLEVLFSRENIAK